MSALWVVVPAYNEAPVIRDTLVGLSAYMPRVVVVDDASSDGTADFARAFGVHVVRHRVNLGQGAALATGLEFVLSRGADFVCTFDADGQHDAGSIAIMEQVQREQGVEVVLASRFIVDYLSVPPARRALLRAAVAFTRMHTGLGVSDTHNGLRFFTRRAASLLDITQPRMAHGSQILSRIASNRLTFVEVPSRVIYTDYTRSKGQSGFNAFKIVWDLFYDWLVR